jgi:hypothetical protein
MYFSRVVTPKEDTLEITFSKMFLQNEKLIPTFVFNNNPRKEHSFCPLPFFGGRFTEKKNLNYTRMDKGIFRGNFVERKWIGVFCIVNDFIESDYRETKEDKAKRKKYNLNTFFELFDDDGIKYYSGYLNAENLEKFEMDEFAVLGWGTNHAGCTEIKLRSALSGKMETL